MLNFRRTFINETRNILNSALKAQEREKNTLANISRLGFSKEVVLIKTQELKISIEKREDDIFLLETKITDISCGVYDEQIQEELDSQKLKISAGKNKREQVSKQKVDDEIANKNFLKGQYKDSNDERQKDRDMKYFYKQFLKIEDSIPNYIRDNLKNMPNNKGYLWRGCWCMGELEAEEGPTILFEKRGNVTKIHEYEPHVYNLYEKKGKERKRLISSEPRKKLVRQRI